MNKKNNTLVRLETSEGNITIKLYDETPGHRDNFLKLVKEGIYDGLLFHRVIKNFMIQGGDPQSKDAPQGKALGSGGMGYTVPAEFVYPKYFHKRGALSAARQGDAANPEKASSSSQFYIVWGEIYTEEKLAQFKQQKMSALQQNIFNRLRDENQEKILELHKNNQRDELQTLKEKLIAQMETEAEQRKGEIEFTPEQVKAYTTTGGTPHLDGEYTVYGEVVDGLEVVEKIQAVETGRNNRPLADVTLKAMLV